MNRTTQVFASTLFAAGLALAATASPASAQDATYLADDASHCEIFRSLSRIVPSYCAEPGDLELEPVRTRGLGKTRGIRLHQSPEVSPMPVHNASVEVDAVEQKDPPKELAIAMRVQFEYDSFRLTDDAKVVLDRVAGVLKEDLMSANTVQIEGHADAHGPDQYNLMLSQMRARSVRAYLVQEHGLDPERLPFVGKGENEPFDSDPFNGINRRVEFTNITG